MTVETQVLVVNGVTTNTYSGDGLRRSVRTQGASPVTFAWDGADYLKEKS
jgi:YD repeat-containing protein